jgi:hypothetical protein
MQDVVIESCRTGVVIVGGVSAISSLLGKNIYSKMLIAFIRLEDHSALAKVWDLLSWSMPLSPTLPRELPLLSTGKTPPHCFYRMWVSIIPKMPFMIKVLAKL